jgi:hypothetical protein
VGYAPGLNLDEPVWNHMKPTGTAKKPFTRMETGTSREFLDPFDIAVLRNGIDRRMIFEQFRRLDKQPW